MKHFEYINREYVNPIDLNILGKTFDTLEQGHQQAVKASSDLEVAMANLDLNEKESQWRQQKINQIKQTLDDNTLYGNAYGALDDVVKLAGNLAADQGMIGRLQAQKDYKAYQDMIDKSQDLPQDYKEFFKENNKYDYKDIIDKNTGQIIGGTKWTPSVSPTKVIPLNQLMNQALQWAAKESGGGSATRWLDANGNVTSNYSESATGEIFDTTTGKWEKLTKEKLNAALQASIQSTPGAKESLHQDWVIAKWKKDKYGENPDIVDKNGKELDENTYLQKRINPFFDAASYYNQTSTTQYGNAVKAQINNRNKGNNGINTGSGRVPDISTSLSNPITIKNVMPSQAAANITSSKQIISKILGDNIDITKMSNEDIINTAKNKKISTSNLFKINMALDDIQENQEYINNIKQTMSLDEQAQFDVYNSIMSLSDLPDITKDNEKYIKKWQDYINQFFGGAKAIRQYYSDDDGIDAFYSSIGGKDSAIALGIKEGSINGKRYVELPTEYSNSLYSFGKAAKAAYDDTHNLIGAGINKVKNVLYNKWGDNITRVNSDGTENPVYRTNKGEVYSETRNHAGFTYNKMLSFVNNLEAVNNKVIGGDGNITVSNAIINASTPAVAEILAIRKSNPEEASKYTQVLDDEQKEIFTSTSNIDLVQTGAFVVGDDNTLREVSSNERKEYTGLLRSAKDNDLTITAIQDPKSGNWGAQITIKGTTDESGDINRKPITLYVPGGINSQVYDSWNRDTTFRAKNDINTYKAANRPITIASSNLFGIDSSIKLKANGNGFTVYDGQTPIRNISDEEAIVLRDNYYQWKYAYNAITSGEQVMPEAIDAIAKEVSFNIAKLYNPKDDGKLALYYYGCLTNSLNK